jgi:hypothetical protein
MNRFRALIHEFVEKFDSLFVALHLTVTVATWAYARHVISPHFGDSQ